MMKNPFQPRPEEGREEKPLPPSNPELPADAPVPLAVLSQWELIRLRFAKHQLAVVSLHLICLLYVMAIFAEFFAPYPSGSKEVAKIYCPPQLPMFSLEDGFYVNDLERQIDPVTFQSTYVKTEERVRLGFLVKGQPYELFGLIPMERRFFGAVDPEDRFYLLGADKFGRDIYSRIVFGARVSLSIGIVSIIVTFVLGALIGGISGYVGGRTDNVIQRLIEIINSFPHLPLWLALAAVLPPDWSALATYFAITIVLSLLGWTGLARVIRGKILSLREEDYAVAARLIGAGHGRVIFRHLLPGFTSHIIVSLSLSVPGMILGETALSFLGLGLRAPVVSWGVMLQDCLNIDVVANYPWLLMPVLFIVLTVLAFNFFGDGMRDAADPYSSR